VVGSTVQLSAKATMTGSATEDVTAQAQWSSTLASVATVSSGGLVTFRAAGDADIVAAYQGFSAHGTMRGTSCDVTASAVSALNAVGGSGTVAVTIPSPCRWTMATSDSWIRISGDGPFTGPMSVGFVVSPNRSFGARSGSMLVKSVSGDTLATYAVPQRGAGCLYSTNPSAVTLGPMGTYDGAGDSPLYVRVHAEPADCQWTATSTVPWARVVYGSDRGTGDQLIYVSLIQTNTGPTRIGDIVVAGLSGLNPDGRFSVTQTGQ